MKPQRIQLSRAKGFNLQIASNLRNGLDAVNVARPGPWGNPFVVGVDGTRAECVRLYSILLSGRLALSTKATLDSQRAAHRFASDNWQLLRGKNLACWCPAHAECHADVLIEMVDKPVCVEVSV